MARAEAESKSYSKVDGFRGSSQQVVVHPFEYQLPHFG